MLVRSLALRPGPIRVPVKGPTGAVFGSPIVLVRLCARIGVLRSWAEKLDAIQQAIRPGPEADHSKAAFGIPGPLSFVTNLLSCALL